MVKRRKELDGLFDIAKEAACKALRGKIGTKVANATSRAVNSALRAHRAGAAETKKPKKKDC